MGEPLLTPYLPQVYELLDKYSVKMNIVTNGTLLTESISRELMSHLSTIKVSFDGARKSSFEGIRRGADFDKVVENIRRFNMMRNETESDGRPILMLQVTLIRKNIEELPEIVEFASRLGVDMVVGLHVYVFDQKFKSQSLFYHKQISDKYTRIAEQRAAEIGVQTHFPTPFNAEFTNMNKEQKDTANEYRPRKCKFLWREAWVSYKGDVTPCCVPNRPIMGNLYEDTFEEIWNGEMYKEMRKRLNTDEPFECCKNCSLATQYEPGLGYRYDERAFLMYD